EEARDDVADLRAAEQVRVPGVGECAAHEDRVRGVVHGAVAEAERRASGRRGLRLGRGQPRRAVDAREVLLEDAELPRREPARRMAERVVEGLLELRDGRGALVVEEREVVLEDAPCLPASDAA